MLQCLAHRWSRLRAHVQKRVVRYAVALTAVIIPAAGVLSTLAADLDGRAVFAAAMAVGVVVALITSGITRAATPVAAAHRSGV